jgi:hypothetical protein
MENTLNNISSKLEQTIVPVIKNPYVMGILKIVLVLYAAKIAPNPPGLASKLFENTFFKIAAVFVIAFLAEFDFQLSLLLAIVFVLGTNLLSGRNMLESFINGAPFTTDRTKMTNIFGKPAVFNSQQLLESKTDNYPGCNNVSADDLLALFGGDSLKMQKNIHYAIKDLMDALPNGDAKAKLVAVAKLVGVADNVVVVNDDTAPFIATMLLQYGFIVSDTCKIPGA